MKRISMQQISNVYTYTPDSRGVEIQKVGIKDFELPIVIQRKDAEDKVIYASATCGVTLPAHYKGTHMSRFVEVLNEWRGKKTLDIKSCVVHTDNKSFDFVAHVDVVSNNVSGIIGQLSGGNIACLLNAQINGNISSVDSGNDAGHLFSCM